VQRLADAMRRHTLRRRPFEAIRRIAATVIRRRLSRLPRPGGARGLFVAVLGPDGSGKTSAIDRLAGRAPLPVARWYLGAYPAETPGRGRRGAAGLRFVGRVARLVRGSVAARVHAARGGLAVTDRHPIELPAFGRGVRRVMMARLALGPDMILVLDAPAEMLRARKPEHDVADLERARTAYRRLAETDSRVVILDATRSPSRTAEDVMRTIWGEYASRRGGMQAAGRRRAGG
jgi:ABC-type transport system involved in cytochrome c biogenesis ATPase subunit